MRRIALVVGILVVVAVVLVGLKPFGGSAATVETATVTKGTLESTIELAGSVAAHDTRTLAFGSTGRVAEVKVAAGDPVEAGAVVATLDDAVANAQLSAARLAVESANAAKTSATASLTAARSRYDADKKAGQPAAVLDADRAQMRAAEAQQAAASAQAASAQAQVEAAQVAVDNLTLTSPIGGTVVSVGLEPGDLVAAGGTVGGRGTIVVADLARLEVTSSASEIDVVSLTADMPVSLTFDALPDLALEGTICELGNVGSGTGGVVEFPVTICLAKQDPGLRVGMSANVSIVLARAEGALIVPAQAIKTVDGKPTVRVLGADGKISTVVVEVGISSGTRTQLVSGVAEGDKVVLGAAATGG